MNKDILYGTLLGDAFLSKLPQRGVNRQLCYEHSRKQLDYVLYKATRINMPFKFYTRDRYDKRTNKIYHSVSIHHMANPLFNQLHEEFYVNNIKTISAHILSQLTPEAIAIWYCDDGSLYMNKDTKILTLHTQGFDTNSLNITIGYFYDKFNIEFKEQRGDLRLTSLRKIEKFMSAFGVHIPQCMSYKFTDRKIQ